MDTRRKRAVTWNEGKKASKEMKIRGLYKNKKSGLIYTSPYGNEMGEPEMWEFVELETPAELSVLSSDREGEYRNSVRELINSSDDRRVLGKRRIPPAAREHRNLVINALRNKEAAEGETIALRPLTLEMSRTPDLARNMDRYPEMGDNWRLIDSDKILVFQVTVPSEFVGIKIFETGDDRLAMEEAINDYLSAGIIFLEWVLRNNSVNFSYFANVTEPSKTSYFSASNAVLIDGLYPHAHAARAVSNAQVIKNVSQSASNKVFGISYKYSANSTNSDYEEFRRLASQSAYTTENATKLLEVYRKLLARVYDRVAISFIKFAKKQQNEVVSSFKDMRNGNFKIEVIAEQVSGNGFNEIVFIIAEILKKTKYPGQARKVFNENSDQIRRLDEAFFVFASAHTENMRFDSFWQNWYTETNYDALNMYYLFRTHFDFDIVQAPNSFFGLTNISSVGTVISNAFGGNTDIKKIISWISEIYPFRGGKQTTTKTKKPEANDKASSFAAAGTHTSKNKNRWMYVSNKGMGWDEEEEEEEGGETKEYVGGPGMKKKENFDDYDTDWMNGDMGKGKGKGVVTHPEDEGMDREFVGDGPQGKLRLFAEEGKTETASGLEAIGNELLRLRNSNAKLKKQNEKLKDEMEGMVSRAEMREAMKRSAIDAMNRMRNDMRSSMTQVKEHDVFMQPMQVMSLLSTVTKCLAYTGFRLVAPSPDCISEAEEGLFVNAATKGGSLDFHTYTQSPMSIRDKEMLEMLWVKIRYVCSKGLSDHLQIMNFRPEIISNMAKKHAKSSKRGQMMFYLDGMRRDAILTTIKCKGDEDDGASFHMVRFEFDKDDEGAISPVDMDGFMFHLDEANKKMICVGLHQRRFKMVSFDCEMFTTRNVDCILVRCASGEPRVIWESEDRSEQNEPIIERSKFFLLENPEGDPWVIFSMDGHSIMGRFPFRTSDTGDIKPRILNDDEGVPDHVVVIKDILLMMHTVDGKRVVRAYSIKGGELLEVENPYRKWDEIEVEGGHPLKRIPLNTSDMQVTTYGSDGKEIKHSLRSEFEAMLLEKSKKWLYFVDFKMMDGEMVPCYATTTPLGIYLF